MADADVTEDRLLVRIAADREVTFSIDEDLSDYMDADPTVPDEERCR